MKKKLGIRTLAAILVASVVMSASAGTVSAKNNGANVSVTGDVSDTSSASETTSRASAKSVSQNVSVEGAALSTVKVPSGLSGYGTDSSPYQIGSLSDLLLMNSYINYENSANKEFVLTKDIDLSKVTFSNFTESDGIWSLVSAKASLSGNANVRFHLNGNGHKLFGLNASVSKNAATAAIFGYVNPNSVIENLTVASCTLRVNSASDGAYAVLAVQNSGSIAKITMTDCVLDARLGGVQTRATDDGTVSGLSRVYVGHAIGVADNAGKVSNFTVTGSDTNKGVFVKGARRYVGVVAGQNRKDVNNVTVSGMRILSYGSEDGDSAVSGKGETAQFVGMVAGRNGKSASVTSAVVTLKYGADILFGDAVGGLVGENAGTIEDSSVTGTNASGASVTSSSANLYGCGRYGAIAGVSSGTIRACGAYDVGFCFAQSTAQNVYGGIAGENSGTITNCASSGSVNVQSSTSAGVGGLVGHVTSGALLQGNYSLVSVSQQGANVGALVGKEGTAAYVGQSNFWSSSASGLSTPAPNDGAGQNDLTAAKPVVVLSKSTAGVTLDASALAWSWQGGKGSAAADFTKNISISNSLIRMNKTTNSVTLSCVDDGTVGALSYAVSVSVPAGISGRKMTARVSIPVFATASASAGAGASVRNPILISDAKQMEIMQYAPAAHYKLNADITVGSDWKPIDFSGTLNGAGHTLRISKPLFASVTGSRDGAVSDEDWKVASTNLVSGFIYDLNLVPTTCIYGGVFGDVKNATLRDVTYAVNGENDGFVALSASKSGALIDTLSGNVYLNRCKVSVPIAVTAESADGIGALVGYAAPANLIAENCETTSLISLEKNPANVGGLFGCITSAGGTAQLLNCSATGCVYVPVAVSEVRANIMVGAASGVKASGCTYAVPFGVEGGSVSKTAAPFTEGVTELNPQSDEAKQSAEDARSMLSLIDPELIEQAELNGLSPEGGIYKLRTATDVTDMMAMLNSGDFSDTAHTGVYELQNDIDMNGAALMMATSAEKAFCGTFRSSSGNNFTLSNFTVTNTGTNTSDPYTYPEAVYTTAAALFCYANGASFEDITISDVTVVSDGVGTAVLVGIADIWYDPDEIDFNLGDYTECSFENINITDCNVYSNFIIDAEGYGLENCALAGTLMGAAWSANAGDIYTITGITVSDCSVINRNWDEDWTYYSNPNDYASIGGSWGIGGLIGGSRLSDGTLCIGESGDSASVILEHITVVGFGGVGGVIGIAGTSSLINAAAQGATVFTNTGAAGGIDINRVTVRGKESGGTTLRSSITAGKLGTNGGCCGGILGLDLVPIGAAAIHYCVVSDTDILSDNDLASTAMTGFAADTGGIAGHMSGTVEYCTVTNSTIKSCVAGGIVGRSSRKAQTHAGSLVTIRGCQVKGNTEIGFDGYNGSSNNVGEAGGILASARFASVVIDACSVGSTVSISSDHWLYAGGFIGYTNSTGTAYTVTITDSITNATVTITATRTESAVGGAVGYEGMYQVTGTTAAKMKVSGCVLGGTLSDKDYFCGGVFGYLKNAASATANVRLFDIENCAVTATLSSETQYRAKLIAYYNGSATTIANNNRYWTYRNSIIRDIKGTIFSSYPQEIECLGYYKNNSAYYLMGDRVGTVAHLKNTGTDSLISNGCVEDINRPSYLNSSLQDTTQKGLVYLSGETTAKTLDGKKETADETREFTVSMTNQPVSSLVTFDNSDGAAPNAESQYAGWVSSNFAGNPVNNTFFVMSTSSAASVNITAKLDSNAVGLKGHYTVTGFTDADTNAAAQFTVYVPLELTQIPPPGLNGNGSQANPWQITNLEELNGLRSRDLSKNSSSTGTDKGCYILMNDIDASGSGFEPITDQGHSDGPFCGSFDGNGNTISGLTIDESTTGLFNSTSGATIKNLTISGAAVSVPVNTNATPNVITGYYASALVGQAEGTTFTNVTIKNSVIGGDSDTYPTAYAGALAAYATDCVADRVTLENVTVHYAYFTGGLYGHAHYTNAAADNKILGTTIRGLTVTSTALDTSTNYDGTHSGKIDVAGGLAAEFAGTISRSTTGNVPNTIESKKTTTDHQIGGFEQGETPEYETLTLHGVKVIISGSVASGAVGSVADGTVCSVGYVNIGSDTDCMILSGGKYVEDTSAEVTISSGRTLANKATAGGIVGKFCDEPASYTGAATNPGVTLTLSNCSVNDKVAVSAMLNAGGILGHSSANGAASPITITDCSSLARVSEVLPDTTIEPSFATDNYYVKAGVGSIAGRVFDITHLRVERCVAGGKLTATSNAGGVVGVVPFNNQGYVPDLQAADGVRISNTVFSAELTVGDAGLRGVLFGSVKTAQLPTNLSASPFQNIYYSSYQVPTDMQTTLNDELKVMVSGDDAYLSYQTTFVDLMTDFGFASDLNPDEDGDPNTDDDYIYSSRIRVPLEGVQFSMARYDLYGVSLWSGIDDTNGTLQDNYEEFSCPTGVLFKLDTIISEQNKQKTGLIVYDDSTGTVTPKGNDSGDLVFVYKNGLKLKLDLIASDIKGEGTQASPFLIERIGHLNTIKSLPDAYYVLAADIDFNVNAANTTYYTAHGQLLLQNGYGEETANEQQQERLAAEVITDSEKAWAATWEDWATSLTRADKKNGEYLYRFTGTLDGEWFAYNYSTDTYASSGAKTQHSISNLTVTTDGLITDETNNFASFTGVGFFPVIEEGATVKNITFSNCNFTSTSTAGVYNPNKGVLNASNQKKYVYENDAGVLAAVNRGKIQGVTVDNCVVVSKVIKTVSGATKQSHHVGAIAGVSYGKYTETTSGGSTTYTVDPNTIENCTVQNSKVTSSHCAGGIVGGGASVSGCSVTNTYVTATDYAGGIAGGNLAFPDNKDFAEEIVASNGDRRAMQASTYTNCKVKGCTIGSAYQQENANPQPAYALEATTVDSSVGGILGCAEPGDSTTYGYRSVSITNCTVDCQANSHSVDTTSGHTTIIGYADTSDQNGQQNFAGGMIGQVGGYYEGLAVENCASYAGVYAYGDYWSNTKKTAASALVGSVSGNNFKVYESGTATIRFLNNVCSGDLHSPYIAGGVCGLFDANVYENGTKIPSTARFACGNIISTTFELLGEVGRNNLTTYNKLSLSDGFGVMIGICTPVSENVVGCFANGAAPSTMQENYYSSYVSKIGSSPVKHFSTTKGVVTECDGLYDVASYTGYDSSFLVKNYKYNMHEHDGGSVTWTMDEAETWEDTVTAPEYHDDVNDVNVYPGHNDPNHTNPYYNMNMQLIFTKGSNNGTPTYSCDFADPSNTLTVDSSNVGQSYVAHTLSLTQVTDIYVTPNDPNANEFYSGEKALSNGSPQKSTVKLTIHRDPSECDKSYYLIADLDYGLLVGITIKTPTGTGDKKDPYKIKNAAEFCHYFFNRADVMDDGQEYLTKYYAQTADIDFGDILKTLAMTDQEHYPKYDENDDYGYRKETGSGNNLSYSFIQGKFAPIGTETWPFTGGYNGGWTTTNNENGIGHKITNFYYDAGTSNSNRTDVGLFGYVSDKAAAEGEYRLRNIHIELRETALDTDDYIPAASGDNASLGIASASPTAAEYAGVFGGLNTGGLAGVYASACNVDNCSVVYGTVSSDNLGANVGGLFGKVQSTATISHCFTSTNVRVLDDIRDSGDYNFGNRVQYTCGGLIGLQESLAPAAVSCKFDNCFCSSDVVGVYFVGSFVAEVGENTHIELTNCASTATVTGLSPIINRDALVTPIVVGLTPVGTGVKPYAIDGSDTDPYYVKAVNVYVAGMNTVEYKYRSASEQHYASLFGSRPLLTGSSGVYYDASTLGRVTLPNGTASPYIIRVSGEVRSVGDALLSGAQATTAATYSAPFTTNTTDKQTDTENPLDGLTDTDHPLGSTDYFDTSIDGLYPVLQMQTRSGYSKDPYFAAFSKLSALPMKTDDRELDDKSSLRSYVGVTYPTTVAKTLGLTHAAEYVDVLDANNQPVLDENDQPEQQLVRPAYTGQTLTIESSKYSASSDTLPYNADYDYLLEGNARGSNTDHNGTDMKTDLLFDRSGSDFRLLRNTNLTSGMTYYRNERSPFVRVTAWKTVEGQNVSVEDIHRTIHVGLRSSQNTSYIATERQLRSLTAPEASGKFQSAYTGTLNNVNWQANKNIRICADIVFNPNPTDNNYPAFTPITGFCGTGAGDTDEGAFGFDGSNCEICNMKISARQNAGMFDKIEAVNNAGTPTIQNLILRNPTVSGSMTAGALVGEVNHTNTKIINCSVIGGTINMTAGGNSENSVFVGGLVGKHSGGTVRWASVTGVTIVTQTNTAATAATNAGLMFGGINNMTVSDVYAIGDMKTVSGGVTTQGVNAKNVGGLAGVASNCTVSGAVTSGYVGSNCNVTTGGDDDKSHVGGVFGKMTTSNNGTMVANNIVSTAFVTGKNFFAGLIGWLDAGTISNTLFAGTTSATSGNKVVYALLHDTGSTPPAGTTICYDRSLQRSNLEEDYHPMSTWDIVSDNGVPFSGDSFAYDTDTHSYYPNPVNTLGSPATDSSIGNVITDAFKVGLGFALARVNMVYAGTGGSVEEYDEITATSPLSTISSIPHSVTVNNVTTIEPTNEVTIGKPNDADTVSLEEYDVTNMTNLNGATQGYLIDNGDSLSPRIWEAGAYAGVRATLNTDTGSDATFAKKNANEAMSIFRFVVVNACRMAEIEYEIVYDGTAAALDHATDLNKVVLMLKTQQQMTSLYSDTSDPTGANAPVETFSSNAVTSKYQDSDESAGSGTYTVKYRKIAVPSDSRIYVSAMLPSQYKLSDVKAYEWNFGSGEYGANCYDVAGQGKWVYVDPTVNTTANTKIKIVATVGVDPSWGLRDLDGGIG